MKQLIAAVALGLLTVGMAAHAAEPTNCEAKAAEKHLAGAAKASFIKKCEKDSMATTAMGKCEAEADQKKLHGAARNSFVKKCATTAG